MSWLDDQTLADLLQLNDELERFDGSLLHRAFQAHVQRDLDREARPMRDPDHKFSEKSLAHLNFLAGACFFGKRDIMAFKRLGERVNKRIASFRKAGEES